MLAMLIIVKPDFKKIHSKYIADLTTVLAGDELLSFRMFGGHVVVQSSFPKALLATSLAYQKLS